MTREKLAFMPHGIYFIGFLPKGTYMCSRQKKIKIEIAERIYKV